MTLLRSLPWLLVLTVTLAATANPTLAGAAGGAAQSATEQYARTGTVDGGQVMKDAAVGMAGGKLGAVASKVLGCATNKAVKAVAGAAADAGSGMGTQMVDNALNGRPLGEGTLQAGMASLPGAGIVTSVMQRSSNSPQVTDSASFRVGPYSDLSSDSSPGQAHHLNQDAAFKSAIPTAQGMSVKLEGNAFTDVDSPHYNAHQSLEGFWNQFRRGGARAGEKPTNLEYSKAMCNSLRAAGLNQDQVRQAARASISQRVGAGQLGGVEVPRVPSRVNQKRKKR